MLAKRIIPCLDVKNGRTVKGINFVALADAGDPVELGQLYSTRGADELVFLDITATHEKRKTVTDLARRVAQHLNIPFTIGGGISSEEDVYAVLKSGADKVSLNSAVLKDPGLVRRLSRTFGSQCIVVAIDAKMEQGGWRVYMHGGRIATQRTLFEWAKECEDNGAGEILFTSMNHDGTKKGFALEALDQLSAHVRIPVIASGGAGKRQHFVDLFKRTQVSAGLAASIFHFGEMTIPDLKNYLHTHHIPIRSWTSTQDR